MLQRSILCIQGTQYATKRSILCRGAFCGPTAQVYPRVSFPLNRKRYFKCYLDTTACHTIIHTWARNYNASSELRKT